MNHRLVECLAGRTESILAGQVRGRYVDEGLPVPPWAELNWLAHAQPSDIRACAAGRPGLNEPTGTWPWALRILARELVAHADENQDPIVELQRQCLIPMELTLMGHGSVGFLPKHLVALGVLRLRSHGHARGRPDRPHDGCAREQGGGGGGREPKPPYRDQPFLPL